MRQCKIEVLSLSRPAQVGHTLAAQASFHGRRAPTLHQSRRTVVFRLITGVDELARNPRTADLVLLAKLSARAGSDQEHLRMAADQVLRQSSEVSKASQVRGVTCPGGMNEFCSGGRKQDQRPVTIYSRRDFGGTVVQFKLVRSVSRNFAGPARDRVGV